MQKNELGIGNHHMLLCFNHAKKNIAPPERDVICASWHHSAAEKIAASAIERADLCDARLAWAVTWHRRSRRDRRVCHEIFLHFCPQDPVNDLER